MDNNELSFVRKMFDKIAPRYDVLNRLLSLRRDVYWRNKMLSEITISSKIRVLDVACGTGDIIVELINQKGDMISVVGVDFSEKMLSLARKKNYKNFHHNVHFLAADALFLPFANESFDLITMAFGIRNIQNRIKVLKNFHSLLKPSGTLSILELSIPKQIFINKIFSYYFKYILPKVGNFFSNNSFAYSYLPKSVTIFPNTDDFILIMKKAGFSQISYKKLSMGIANLFLGHKI